MVKINGNKYNVEVKLETGTLINTVTVQLIKEDGNIVSEGKGYCVDNFYPEEIAKAVENCLMYFTE